MPFFVGGGMASSTFAGNAFAVSEARMRLASHVTGRETPAQLAQIQAHDKVLGLRKVQDDTNYQIALAIEERDRKQFQKEMERRQRRYEQGFLA